MRVPELVRFTSYVVFISEDVDARSVGIDDALPVPLVCAWIFGLKKEVILEEPTLRVTEQTHK